MTVLRRLGEPHGKVAGAVSSGPESWTYIVKGGAFAKVKLDGGRVTSVVVPN